MSIARRYIHYTLVTLHLDYLFRDYNIAQGSEHPMYCPEDTTLAPALLDLGASDVGAAFVFVFL